MYWLPSARRKSTVGRQCWVVLSELLHTYFCNVGLKTSMYSSVPGGFDQLEQEKSSRNKLFARNEPTAARGIYQHCFRQAGTRFRVSI